ncbi:MAG: hypothetical protein QGF90_13520, partial [Gammaproteobacteria bacterium]|nr:hypothetical protein [Gammaproteobacteria bacterium]
GFILNMVSMACIIGVLGGLGILGMALFGMIGEGAFTGWQLGAWMLGPSAVLLLVIVGVRHKYGWD